MSTSRFLLAVSLAFGAIGWAREFQFGPATRPVAAVNFAQSKQTTPLRFIIVPDRTGGNRPGVWEAALKLAAEQKPDFLMSIGDYIEGNTKELARIERERKEELDILAQIPAPFFLLPGNHDIGNPVMKLDWENRLGPTYYWFVTENVLFICMNTEDPPGGGIGDDQRDAIIKTLGDHKDVAWTFILMHRPAWRGAANISRPWQKIEESLKGRKYTVFAGHDHNFAVQKRQEQEYYILATAGGSLPKNPGPNQFDHITQVTFEKDAPVIETIRLAKPATRPTSAPR